MAQAGLLGNVGATLLAAGQRISPADRARLLSQLGPQTAQFSTDIYNAAQRRYQQGVLQEAQRKQTLAEKLATAEEERKAAEAERKAGEPARMAEGAAAATAMGQPTYQATKHNGETPVEWGEVKSAYSPQDQYLALIKAGFSPSAAENFVKVGEKTESKTPELSPARMNTLLAQGRVDPAVAATPEYAIAFYNAFKPRTEVDNEGDTIEVPPEIPAGQPIPEGYTRPVKRVIKYAPPTQNQQEAAGFWNMMGKAGETLVKYESDENKLNLIKPGLVASNWPSIEDAMATPERRSYLNAAKAWIRAKLRRESGAAISNQEYIDEYSTYFPTYYDTPEIIRQKAAFRKVAESSMLQSAGRAANGQRALTQEDLEELNRALSRALGEGNP
jgi:hypothetical protein